VWIMYRQREWLRAHLRTTDSAKSRIEASPTDGDPKRRRRNKADRAG